MTGNEYQQLAMRTCQDPILDHAIFGLVSEACSALDLKLEDVMEQNIEKLLYHLKCTTKCLIISQI